MYEKNMMEEIFTFRHLHIYFQMYYLVLELNLRHIQIVDLKTNNCE